VKRATAHQRFRVTVSRGRRPVPGATVCLTYKDRIIARGRTNSSGVADLIMNMSGKGTVEVTVTGSNIVPHLGLVEVREQLDDLNDLHERTEDVLDRIHERLPGRPLGGGIR
jgi:hypothetical protein